jgi:hypothetical protein
MSILKTNAIQTVSGKPLLNSSGSIIQIVSSNPGAVAQSITSSVPVALNGLSVTITPTSATSTILIEASISSNEVYVMSFHLYRNGASLIANHGSNTQTGGGTALITKYSTGGASETSAGNMRTASFIYRDSPGSTSPQTYQVYANAGWNGGVNTLVINNRTDNDMLCAGSCIKAMEVTG